MPFLNGENLSLRQFIIVYNNKFPFDYEWRKKYNIPFGSKAHLRMNFIDMVADLMEERLYKAFAVDYRYQQTIDRTKLLKTKRVNNDFSSAELDSTFEEMDLDDFDDVKI